jgi:hypothetical protein
MHQESDPKVNADAKKGGRCMLSKKIVKIAISTTFLLHHSVAYTFVHY